MNFKYFGKHKIRITALKNCLFTETVPDDEHLKSKRNGTDTKVRLLHLVRDVGNII